MKETLTWNETWPVLLSKKFKRKKGFTLPVPKALH